MGEIIEQCYKSGIGFALDWDFFCRDFYKFVVQNAGKLATQSGRRAFLQGAGISPEVPDAMPRRGDYERTMFYGILHRTLAMIANGKIAGCECGTLSLLVSLFQAEAYQEHYYWMDKMSGLWSRFEESLDSGDKELTKTGLFGLTLLTPLVVPDAAPADLTEALEAWHYTTLVFESLFERIRRNAFCFPYGKEAVKGLEKEAIELFAKVLSEDLLKIGDGDFEYFPVKNLLAMLCCVSGNQELERNFKADLPDDRQDEDMLTPLMETLEGALLRVVWDSPRFHRIEPEEYVSIFKADRAIGLLSDGTKEEIVHACIRDGYAPALLYSGAMDFDEFFRHVGDAPGEQGKKGAQGRIYRGLSLREGEDKLPEQMEEEFFTCMEAHVEDNASDARILKKHLTLIKNGIIDMFRTPVHETEPGGISPDSAYGKYLGTLSRSLEKHRGRDMESCGECDSQLVEVSF